MKTKTPEMNVSESVDIFSIFFKKKSDKNSLRKNNFKKSFFFGEKKDCTQEINWIFKKGR